MPVHPLTKSRLTEQRVQAGLPALAAASARRGGSVQVWVDGERSIGSGVAVKDSDVWHLGSISKPMTATLVARLVDLGAVCWDDCVGEVLSIVAPAMNECYRSATFRHLLSHRSGLPANIPAEQFRRFSPEIDDAREERKVYAGHALAMAPHGPMGATFKYSNCGYIVVAAMLEAKLSQSWESLMHTHVFKPLELATAGFGAPGHHGALDQPVGHRYAGSDEASCSRPKAVGVTDNPVVLGPAGRIHMSLQDLLRFLVAHRDHTKFLNSQTWTMLHNPAFGGDYALGWFVRNNGELWHNGSNDFWYIEALVNTTAGIAAAAVSNDGRMSPAVGRTLREAAAAA